MAKIISFALFITIVVAVSGSTQEKIDPEKWGKQAEETNDKLDSYTAIFHKQERVNGKLLEEETIFLKFKKPFQVYMKWIKDPYKGREVLYVEGWNQGQIMAHEGGITGIVTLNLNPRGSMAMKGNRHPVTDTGIGHLIKIISENIRRRMKAGGFKLLEDGEETVYGRKTRKVEVVFERDRTKGYYGYRVVINLDEEKKVPIKIQIYDWGDQLVESYGYENLNLNAGLTDADFDPKNPECRF